MTKQKKGSVSFLLYFISRRLLSDPSGIFLTAGFCVGSVYVLQCGRTAASNPGLYVHSAQINYKIISLEQLMDAPTLKPTNLLFLGKDHTSTFDHVRFAYKEEGVLHGISLTVPEGSMTALVGESGGGKSTLANLLVHYYDVTGGSIKIGGQDIRRMSIEALTFTPWPAMEANNELCKGKTLLVSSHRLNTIRGADQILVVSDVQIAQPGTSQELMSQDGIYRNFVTMLESSKGWNRRSQP